MADVIDVLIIGGGPVGMGLAIDLAQRGVACTVDAGPELAAAFSEAADKLKVPLTVIEDSLEGGRELYEANAILVRPDHFIAWTGDAEPEKAAEILRYSIGG